MSEKTAKLVLTKSAPDMVRINFGTAFQRTFKREEQPFTVERKFAKMLLRASSETFAEFIEAPAKPQPAETPKETKK